MCRRQLQLHNVTTTSKLNEPVEENTTRTETLLLRQNQDGMKRFSKRQKNGSKLNQIVIFKDKKVI